jgi:hypothetical protein
MQSSRWCEFGTALGAVPRLSGQCGYVAAMLDSTVGKLAHEPGGLGMEITVGAGRGLGLTGMPAGDLCKHRG